MNLKNEVQMQKIYEEKSKNFRNKINQKMRDNVNHMERLFSIFGKS